MNILYVRWMGAFRKNGKASCFMDSLLYEYNREDEVALEYIRATHGKYHSNVAKPWIRVGLMISEENIFRWFKSDCWSEYRKGRLYPSKPKNLSDHT